ncbi:GAF and ANTAR domain-containing protein [Streptomyces sp. NBC_01304]|uniref:GAF and ANTAR domain-containing protein n=1 Tax=Streptomyces sp. NBC_01304 TaxID=2903818 RepID=UPI002E117B11|nr:GAF and ANTAR domain-containing protein [Streptomyces sp. NBC_01304]
MPETPREERLASAFVELTNTLVRDFDVIGFLHTLSEHCVDLLDVAAAGVLLGIPLGRAVEAAASDERNYALELAGAEWDEGPCRDCFHARTPIDDVRLDTEDARIRWPHFAPHALQLGFTSVVAAPLRWQEQVIGALNLFRSEPGPLDAGQLHLAQALADTATIGILQQRAAHEQMTVIAQLQQALDSRIIIEQAKGYLAHRRQSNVDEAFTRMRNHARTQGVKLIDVARQVLNGTAGISLLDSEG